MKDPIAAQKRAANVKRQAEKAASPKVLPLECVDCGSATGPMAKVDGEHPGWLCPRCYKNLQTEL